MTWVPQYRTSVRICAVLLRADRADLIDLDFQTRLKITDGLTLQRILRFRRIWLGKLWNRYNGLELARQINQIDRLPADVLAEFDAQKLSA